MARGRDLCTRGSRPFHIDAERCIGGVWLNCSSVVPVSGTYPSPARDRQASACRSSSRRNRQRVGIANEPIAGLDKKAMALLVSKSVGDETVLTAGMPRTKLECISRPAKAPSHSGVCAVASSGDTPLSVVFVQRPLISDVLLPYAECGNRSSALQPVSPSRRFVRRTEPL